MTHPTKAGVGQRTRQKDKNKIIKTQKIGPNCSYTHKYIDMFVSRPINMRYR